MVTIDREGYVQITDRKKDLIKRKGEWISSVDMENAVLAHPGVAEAAVIARFDEICDEVPVVLVVRRDPPELPVAPQDVIDVLSKTFRKWQLPSPRRHSFRRVAAQDQRRQAGQEGHAEDAAGAEMTSVSRMSRRRLCRPAK